MAQRTAGFFVLLTYLTAPGTALAAKPQAAALPPMQDVTMVGDAKDAIAAAHEAARDAATAAHEAADAARAAAQAAKCTADAVQVLATHVEAIEHPEPAQVPQLPEWAYQLTLSGIANAGNNSTYAGKLAGGIDGNWKNWSTEFRLSGAYGSTTPPGTGTRSETTTNNASATARGEHNYTPFLGNYVLGGAAFDHVASIRLQAFGELGITLIWWEVNTHGYTKSRLRTSVGIRMMHESRHQYYPNAEVIASRLVYGPPVTVNYRYALTKDLYITEDADFLYNVAASKDMRFNSTTSLMVKMTDLIALNVAMKVRYIGQPAAGKVNTDTEFSTGLTVAL